MIYFEGHWLSKEQRFCQMCTSSTNYLGQTLGQAQANLNSSFYALKRAFKKRIVFINMWLCQFIEELTKPKSPLFNFALSLKNKHFGTVERLSIRQCVRGGKTELFVIQANVAKNSKFLIEFVGKVRKSLAESKYKIFSPLTYFNALYPACALGQFPTNRPLHLITPQIIEKTIRIGSTSFEYFQNGEWTTIEGVALARVVIPREKSHLLQGVPFLPARIKVGSGVKDLYHECGRCAQDNLKEVSKALSQIRSAHFILLTGVPS